MGTASHPEKHLPGGSRELITLSFPLILSMSFWTVQIFIDRVFLSWVGEDATAAVMPVVTYFWTPMALLNNTVMYVTVFVAQYTGAKRPERIGPVVWQALYFGVFCGAAFPALIPLVQSVIRLTGHSENVKLLESTYFTTLSLAALPMLVVGATNGFFAGRGKSWTVFFINTVGSLVNAGFAYWLIYRQRHDPVQAMRGAGYAAAMGSVASAIVGLILFFQAKYRVEFATVAGWRFDRKLFFRLMNYGLPNGAQWFIESLAFAIFILLIGNIDVKALAASNLTLSLNLLAFLPIMGLGQGVEILVGKRQGEERPDLSEKTTWTGAKLATVYMTIVAVIYCTLPGILTIPFAEGMREEEWSAIAPVVVILLRYVAAYSLVDGLNLILAYALRGAGDTRFVTLTAISLSWPLMVIPTWVIVRSGWGVEAAWLTATIYIATTALVFTLRFRSGRWRKMKVIEAAVVEPDVDPSVTFAGGNFHGTPVEQKSVSKIGQI